MQWPPPCYLQRQRSHACRSAPRWSHVIHPSCFLHTPPLLLPPHNLLLPPHSPHFFKQSFCIHSLCDFLVRLALLYALTAIALHQRHGFIICIPQYKSNCLTIRVSLTAQYHRHFRRSRLPSFSYRLEHEKVAKTPQRHSVTRASSAAGAHCLLSAPNS